LAYEVARRRDHAHVPIGREHRVDCDAHHDFGLPGACGRLEQKLEDTVVETRANRVDRFALIFGEGEGFVGRDKFVRNGNRLRVFVDGCPDRFVFQDTCTVS
jgi:hypothetical protein